MSKEYLMMDAISMVDDKYLEKYFAMKESMANRRNRGKIIKWSLTVAAGLALVIISVPLALHLSGSRSMGDVGNYQICLSEVEERGEFISAKEASAYLKQYEGEILAWVSDNENVSAGSLHISYEGIYHVTVTEDANFINYDMITFYVIGEDSAIVASVDLIRDQDSFIYQINGSGPCTSALNSILAEYPNTDFALIYIGAFTEAAVAPDNTVYFFNGEKEIAADIDYYSMFNREVNLINSAVLE